MFLHSIGHYLPYSAGSANVRSATLIDQKKRATAYPHRPGGLAPD
jgi:hypothetical protein